MRICTFTVTLGIGSVAVAVSAGVDVVKATTDAYIGASANVTAGPGTTASVLVGASDDFYHLSVGAGLAFGGVGVAPAVGVNVITDTTTASIGSSAKVTAAGNISVIANGSENILLIGVGLAAGGVGVGAVVDVLSISNQTTAAIGSSAVVHAGGNVLISAIDNTSVLELSGALGAGFVGVGGAVGVMLITKVTDASIGASANVEGLGNGAAAAGILNGVISGGAFQTTTANGVLVQANSSETVVHIVAAGGAGFVGVSGAVGVASLNITTNATVGSNAVINDANPALANGNQSVYVDAADNFGFQAYVIGVAGGFVGVTGAVDIGTLADNVAAVVDSGASVYAKQSVDVGAAGLQSLTGYVISGAGGVVGVGGSVMDWSIGQALQTNYSDNNGNSADGLVNGRGELGQQCGTAVADRREYGDRQRRHWRPDDDDPGEREQQRGAGQQRHQHGWQHGEQRGADAEFDPGYAVGDAGQSGHLGGHSGGGEDPCRRRHRRDRRRAGDGDGVSGPGGRRLGRDRRGGGHPVVQRQRAGVG